MNKFLFVVDSRESSNARSLRMLGDLKHIKGLVVTEAGQHPKDPNRLVVTLGPPSGTLGGPQPVRVTDPAVTGLPQVRILCVHGVNHLEPDEGGPPTPSEQGWREAIGRALAHWGTRAELHFVSYNRHFASVDLGPMDLAKAVARLGSSGLWHGIQDWFGRSRSRGFGPQGGLPDTLEWTAGMVGKWAGDDRLRARLRAALLDAIREHRPGMILTHSLGTLIAYDALARPANARKPGVAGATLVTFGSQIGHPFVRQAFGGRIVPIPALRHWFHLHNPNDNAFTAPLDVRFRQGEAPNFSQHATPFNLSWDPLNHDASQYLLHPTAVGSIWRDAATEAGAIAAHLPGLPRLVSARAAPRVKSDPPAGSAAPRLRRNTTAHRALLVGLSQYPNPANNLAGCVNDVFLMSRILQETGFAPENIRVLLNHRATSDAILDRLEWLLEGAGDGEDRVFYYAGHGAQIPAYGSGETIDSLDECLVPYNFDWSKDTAVLDDQFHELYSQLPENTRFLTVLDCCHSGGMTREGGLIARGLTPPDDIRHRLLEWKATSGVFTERKIRGQSVLKKGPGATGPDTRHGPLHKLGCAVILRPESKTAYDRARGDFGHRGPFMPFILQACSEGELAYEYRHGAQSNGAFTYFLASTLQGWKGRGPLTWEALAAAVGERLRNQGYTQTPQLVCPTALRQNPIPWQPRSKRRRVGRDQ